MHATVTALSELLALPAKEEQVEDEIQEGRFPEAGQGESVQVQLPQEEAGDETFSDTVSTGGGHDGSRRKRKEAGKR